MRAAPRFQQTGYLRLTVLRPPLSTLFRSGRISWPAFLRACPQSHLVFMRALALVRSVSGVSCRNCHLPPSSLKSPSSLIGWVSSFLPVVLGLAGQPSPHAIPRGAHQPGSSAASPAGRACGSPPERFAVVALRVHWQGIRRVTIMRWRPGAPSHPRCPVMPVVHPLCSLWPPERASYPPPSQCKPPRFSLTPGKYRFALPFGRAPLRKAESTP